MKPSRRWCRRQVRYWRAFFKRYPPSPERYVPRFPPDTSLSRTVR